MSFFICRSNNSTKIAPSPTLPVTNIEQPPKLPFEEFPVGITALIAEYCMSSNFCSIIPNADRLQFFTSFKLSLLNNERTIRILTEINCLSHSIRTESNEQANLNENFCIETVHKIYKFARVAHLLPKQSHVSVLSKVTNKLGIKNIFDSKEITSDLDIVPIIDNIELAMNEEFIDLMKWQYFKKMYNDDVLEQERFEKEALKDQIAEIKYWWYNQFSISNEANSQTEFVLINSNLRFFPKEFLVYKKLKSLSLAGNRIQNLPDEILQLKELEVLDLTSNYLDHIPTCLEKMKHLKELSLKENNVPFCSRIGQMSHIRDNAFSTTKESKIVNGHHWTALQNASFV